jgi:hypothetical protein
MKTELESAVNLMENSLIERQDMLTTMRAQVEQLKELNSQSNENFIVFNLMLRCFLPRLFILHISFFKKTDNLLKQKTSESEKQTKLYAELKTQFNNLENKYEKLNGEKLCFEQTCKQLTEQLLNVDKKKSVFRLQSWKYQQQQGRLYYIYNIIFMLKN